ncbi:hypothetical protein [Paenibacillus sp. 1001270B_150601_E10]|uniref:hypothetical protein n=1 Tax=Paenibacillus sp. 1001270B_150601_E10 TaxID=2787079 RepID=UPI001E46DF06|nr:hypothetical protein [Paenibacillus sp. 1001270B_150601_E10]
MTVILVIVIFSLCTASLTITFVIKGLRTRSNKLSQRKAILMNGTSAQATINAIQQTNSQLDDQPGVLLDLTVTKQDGEVVHTVVETFIPIIHIPSFQKGETIEVKYLTIDNALTFEVVGAYVPR